MIRISMVGTMKAGYHAQLVTGKDYFTMRIFDRLFKKRYTKVTSLCGRYYHIDELALGARGWLKIDNGDWYPFAFWKIKNGERSIATDDEVAKYRVFYDAFRRDLRGK